MEEVIKDAASALAASDDLRILFVQVGNDASASRWLRGLDQALDCKFNVVDIAHSEELLETGIPFGLWVSRSIMADVLVAESQPPRPASAGY